MHTKTIQNIQRKKYKNIYVLTTVTRSRNRHVFCSTIMINIGPHRIIDIADDDDDTTVMLIMMIVLVLAIMVVEVMLMRIVFTI